MEESPVISSDLAFPFFKIRSEMEAVIKFFTRKTFHGLVSYGAPLLHE